MVLTVSVMLKRTVNPSFSRCILPASTNPPIRKLRPCGASLLNTCVGVKYKLTLFFNANNTKPTAAPTNATPAMMNHILFCLGVILLSTPFFTHFITHQTQIAQRLFSTVTHQSDLDGKHQ